MLRRRKVLVSYFDLFSLCKKNPWILVLPVNLYLECIENRVIKNDMIENTVGFLVSFDMKMGSSKKVCAHNILRSVQIL